MAPSPAPARIASPNPNGIFRPSHSRPPLAPRSPTTTNLPQQQHDRIAHHATPSDLMHVAVPLTRKPSDVSDLSGSANEAGSVHSNGVPRNISTDGAASRQPWKQPHLLSSTPPKDSGVVVVERQESGVEVIKAEKPMLAGATDNLTPLVVLLMDPQQKWYELLLMWIDVETDAVRDVFQSVNQRIKEGWKQEYDGFLQLRGGHWNHLINCFAINKYDVVPHEVWIAKPTSMLGRQTIKCADNLIKHMRNIGMVSQGAGGLLSGGSTSPSRKNKGATAPSNNGVLTLSLVARSRIYAPDGVMKPHRGGIFLTFSPPFEPEVAPPRQVTDDHDDGSSNISGLSFEVSGGVEISRNSTHSNSQAFSATPKKPSSTSRGATRSDVSTGSSHVIRERGNRLFFNPKPAKSVQKESKPAKTTGTNRAADYRQKKESRLKLFGGCLGFADCSAEQKSDYEWNLPGSSSDHRMPMLETETTAMTESPSRKLSSGSWAEFGDEFSFVSHEDSFAPLINRHSSEVLPVVSRNEVTDCGISSGVSI